MHNLDERVKDLLDRKVEEVVNRGDISPNEMECICLAYKTKYYMTTTESMENYGEEESMRRSMNGSSRNSYGNSYGDPYWESFANESMRRGRGANGRFVSREGENRSYHSVNDRIIANLERELNTDISDYERQKITDEIRRLREMKD